MSTFVGTSGQAGSGHGSLPSALTCSRLCPAASATISAGTPL
jgi:hypothetical protein